MSARLCNVRRRTETSLVSVYYISWEVLLVTSYSKADLSRGLTFENRCQLQDVGRGEGVRDSQGRPVLLGAPKN